MSVNRGWLSVKEAAQYVGISNDLIRRAVATHSLPAYIKPVSRGRKATSPENQHTYLKINVHDLDQWVRSWEKA